VADGQDKGEGRGRAGRRSLRKQAKRRAGQRSPWSGRKLRDAATLTGGAKEGEGQGGAAR
jgi:hypothetical protein